MHTFIITTGLAVVLVLAGCQNITQTQPADVESEATSGQTGQIIMAQLQLTSPVFNNKGNIPSKYTCDGDDISPPFNISGVPAEAKSLVLVVDDPDAPGGNWDHWLMWNISPSIISIPENTVPKGSVEGTTDFGRTGWGGPCPPVINQAGKPSGTHRYQFKLYALNTVLNLSTQTKKSQLEVAMKDNILAKTVLVGLYNRE